MLTTPTETPDGTTFPAAGTYPARLVAVRKFETAFGWRIGFELELLEGQVGARVLESAAESVSPRSKLVELIEIFTGRPATDTERGGDLHGLIGAPCHVKLAPAMSRGGKPFMRVDRLYP